MAVRATLKILHRVRQLRQPTHQLDLGTTPFLLRTSKAWPTWASISEIRLLAAAKEMPNSLAPKVRLPNSTTLTNRRRLIRSYRFRFIFVGFKDLFSILS
jgi:hypothetical protein